ncbi:MAG: TetR/AcrR family transcriptional regulator [Desulfovermiculus sp.]
MHSDPINERILEAAQAEFASHGYHGAVVSNIAGRAEVGKGTVYRRFGDKQSLFASLIRKGLSDLQENIEMALSQETNPKLALLAVLDVYFDFFDQAQDLIAITILEGVRITSGIHDELKQEAAKVMALFGPIFARGMNEGLFKSRDPDKMAFLLHEFIWSVLRGAVFFGYNPRREFGPDMAEIFLYGIMDLDGNNEK